jgi:predicted TIM-barrel fold metal-dependent hydrolase
VRVIDPLVNVENSWTSKREFTRRAEAELFDSTAHFSRDITADEMVRVLDESGVEKAIIGVDPEKPADWICEFATKYPGRFYLAGEPRIKHGLDALWALEDLCANNPVVAVRAAPMFIKQPATAPLYYPLYAKCVELGLPLCLTTGIPGPPLLQADLQDPMHLDRVCLDFPDLKMVMLHGADPWWGVAIRLLLRHRNLWMVTSAWAPKYLPPDLIHFMNTRGSDKVMFASDYPVLGIDRCIKEAGELNLRPGVLEKYLAENADRVFFGQRISRHVVHAELIK